MDWRSFVFGVLAAYTIPWALVLMGSVICGSLDHLAHARRDREERRKIQRHEHRKALNADHVIAWADVSPHTDVVKDRFHRVTNVDG